MNFAPSEHAHELVACLLQEQCAAHHIAVFVRHPDCIGEAQKIRRVQHRHVQRMTFDPFTAINQPPQRAQLSADRDAERILDRMHGAHLIGDRTDAANARDDVRCFSVAAPAQQRFEEARRLENVELRRGDAAVADLEIERPFALDSREQVDANRLTRHGSRSRFETPWPRG